MFLFQSMPSGDPCALVDHEFAKTLARSLRASLRMQALCGVKPIQHKFHVYFNDIMTLSSKSVPAKKAFFFLQNLNVSVLFPNSILFTPKMGMEHQAVQTLPLASRLQCAWAVRVENGKLEPTGMCMLAKKRLPMSTSGAKL
jgi:hypothetical protein